VLFRDTLGLSPIDIGHGDDVDIRHLRVPRQMVLADLSDANHTDLDFLYHRWLPLSLDVRHKADDTTTTP
jgi:hypothetical protein